MSHTYEVAGAFLGEIPGMINYATEMKIIYEHFGLDEVRILIGRGAGPGASSYFLSEEFAVVMDASHFIKGLLKYGMPYLIEDYRMGVVLGGEARLTVGLREVHMRRGDIGLLRHGTILVPHGFSPDFSIMGLMVSQPMMLRLMGSSLPRVLCRGGLLRLSGLDEEATAWMARHVQSVWTYVGRFGYHAEVVDGMVKALVHFIEQQARTVASSADDVQASGGASVMGLVAPTTLLDRYIELVNAHCHEHRDVGYYADRLHLSPHYFSSLITMSSGVTAKEWIDRAITVKAQVLLRTGTLHVSEVSYQLGFPTPSFFCRFFKRRVGMTPAAYRRYAP